jgi:photosystem II stability/assembly factor-like uncharacterized protein
MKTRFNSNPTHGGQCRSNAPLPLRALLLSALALAMFVASFNSQFSTAHAQSGGVIWTAVGVSAPWRSVASSSDGTTFYAAGVDLWASTDSGVTLTIRNGSRGWAFVNCSADGTKLVASSGDFTPVYTSTDSGMTFTERNSSPPYVTSIASSADGTKLAVAPQDSYDIYTSTDSGVTWVDQMGSGPSKIFSSVASSADGTKLVAVVHGGWIYTSADSGVTWTPRDSPRTWTSVASSTNGAKLVAVDGAPGRIYTSTDSGTNWTAHDSNRVWQAVASSADGTKLVAAVFNGPIYTSTDSGTNWTAGEISPEFAGGYANTDTNMNRAWRSVASSADGTKLVAVDNPGGGTNGLIYISGVVIVPKLIIVNLGTNVGVAWPYPSTGWTLQQNTNLTSASWSPSAGVTNNGHSNYLITSPRGNMFFRLQQQP